jgi:hypothetical protein
MNRVLALIFAVALAIPTLNAADEVGVEELQNYIQALEQRLEQLEAQNGVIQERQIQIEEEAMTYLESLGALKELSDRVELSGNVDVIYSSTDDDTTGANDTNDVFVDQVYLGLAVDVSDNVSAYVSLQMEDVARTAGDAADADDSLEVYEATVTVGLGDNMSLTAGQQHFNFINDAEYGNFIADSAVRQMAECRATGLALSLSNDAISGGVFALNGDNDETGDDDEVNTYGIHASIGGDQEDLSWTLGAAYISNVSDADNGANPVGDGGLGDVSAYSLNGSVAMGDFSVAAEMVQADELDDGTTEPSATSIEASMVLPIGEGDWTLAVKVEETEDGSGDQVEDNVGIGLSSEIYENAVLTINWENAEQYDGDEVDTLAVELRVSF